MSGCDRIDDVTFGIVDGYSGGDKTSPGSAYAPARDTKGNGYRLDKFRGKMRHFLWINNEKRREFSKRDSFRIRRSDRFINSNFTNTVN